MIIEPYKKTPRPPTVALLSDSGEIRDEDGRRYGPESIPENVRVWCSYDVARSLVNDGQGEALTWNGEEIRWRSTNHGDLEGVWKNRPTDVAVIKLPFPDNPSPGLAALSQWRDWLARYGAAPTGTTGSASMSLLRATLEEKLFCTMGEAPPILQTMGGRLEMGERGVGRTEGRLEQWDMQAAYASEIGGMRYGGRWWNTKDLGVTHEPEWWARNGRPVFVHARVKIPEGIIAPLIRRPKKRMSVMRLYMDSLTVPRYPSGTQTGLWTWQELEGAIEAGCTVREILNVYAHLGGSQVFEPWWDAIQDGRAAGGLAGALAKMTGNALWGRFCMDVRVRGDRAIRRREKGKRRLTQWSVADRAGGPRPAHDLAETVSGRVRSRLYRAMAAVGPALISAHTDGMWVVGDDSLRSLEKTGWRQKEAARRIDVLDPQTLRYWPKRNQEPRYVMAGRPAREAPEAFAKLWEKRGQPK